ncbi:MAG: hypothetical protein A2Y40_08380 [Candidatus Margulisbacteria bacterium GWF2_35_9]|nr:MAG: hypothetical protein A2Y40_08380 [Candidatus Margulisbacteria bacterium GWF2_35_9]
MFDSLEADKNNLHLESTVKIVKAILRRKYSDLCSPKYMRMVLNSFKDDPVKCREKIYIKKPIPSRDFLIKDRQKIALIFNEKHYIHHVKERGYVESPVRVASIMAELEKTNLCIKVKTQTFSVCPSTEIPALLILIFLVLQRK